MSNFTRDESTIAALASWTTENSDHVSPEEREKAVGLLPHVIQNFTPSSRCDNDPSLVNQVQSHGIRLRSSIDCASKVGADVFTVTLDPRARFVLVPRIETIADPSLCNEKLRS